MKASELKPGNRIFALFIGRSGSGKTDAEVSFPTPMKIFDFDGRSLGILGATWLSKEHRDKVEIVNVPPGKGFGFIYKQLELDLVQFIAGQRPYETLILDSITSLSDFLMNDARDLLGGLNIGPAGASNKDKLRMTGPADFKYLY